MFKNVASQKIIVFAFDSTNNTPKTGDAANITAYISKDFGAVTVLGDTTATEMDATNAKGYYLFDVTQTETNADCIMVSAKSSTANIVVIGAPATIFTNPANFTTTSIDSNGRLDIIKVAGTTQTAKDIGGAVPSVAAGASGGLLISGSNSGTTTLGALTCTGSFTISDGLLISRSTGNSSAITATGNGTGSGIVATSGSGATGDGIRAIAASTNGNGATLTKTGTGKDLNAQSTNSLQVDVQSFGGTAGTFSAGRPEVNTTHAAGIAWGSGAITAASIADNAIDRATFAADTGMQTLRSGTAQAGSATSITLDASASATTNFYRFALVLITGGTGVGQAPRFITSYNGSTKVANITPGWATNPDNTSTFAVIGGGEVDIAAINGSAISTSSAQIGVNIVTAAGTAWNSGGITSSTFAADSITASAIATDAIGAAELAADAVTEIRNGLGLASANLDTQLSNINNKTTNLPTSPAATGDAMTLTSAYDFAKGTTAMTESYAADNAAMTPVQALYQINQHLGESSISGTTKTVKKRDGSTTAKTFTLDSATTPTSITETT